MRLGTFALLLVSVITGLASPAAKAWDQHHFLTSQLLLSFKLRDPQLWAKLNTPVTVTPIEEFLARAINPSCTWAAAKDTVFGGIGRDYQVLYTSGVTYTMMFSADDWAKGISRLKITPLSNATSGPEAIGVQVKPLEVLTTYCDEPDWGLDDDVPSLKGKGLSQSTEGTSTRLLRHFWYEGESEVGFDLGKDQETNRRAQLYYDLALVAFSVEEPYWGYRFLADSLHYIQDMTQPFHTKAIISGSMVDTLGVVRAKLCEWSTKDGKRPDDCEADMTVDAQVIRSSWIVGSYHAAYEDFARGLLAPTFPHQSYYWLSDFQGNLERNGGAEQLPWKNSQNPLMDLTAVIRAEQHATNAFSDRIGSAAYKALGYDQRYNTDATKAAILAAGKDTSPGYELAFANVYGWDGGAFGPSLSSIQINALPTLVDLTHQLFVRAGIWSRQYLAQVLSSLDDAKVRDAVAARRAAFENKCASAPSL